jgi:purine-cytosine permease-like protein
MEPRLKSSLLWGLTGALSFLVLVQGYRLVTGEGATLLVALGVAVLVAVVASVSSYVLEGRVGRKEQS